MRDSRSDMVSPFHRWRYDVKLDDKPCGKSIFDGYLNSIFLPQKWQLKRRTYMVPSYIVWIVSYLCFTVKKTTCRVPKLFHQSISPLESMTKLTDKKIKWSIDQVVKKKEKTDIVARIQGVSQRRIQQLVAYYKK